MKLFLKYGEIYTVNIKGENFKGIYLGHTVPRKKLKLSHIFLVNKERGDLVKFPYSIIRTKNYMFDKDNNLILQRMGYLLPERNERSYLEELLEKIK